MASVRAATFVFLQYLVPKHALTAVVYHLARARWPWLKDLLIRLLVRLYRIDIEELDRPTPRGFESLNAFFTRPLAPGARPIDQDASAFISPVDGSVSACGTINRDQLFQAKGKHYSLIDLLATNVADADDFVGGSFATIYLAPHNYHRVHAPLAGELLSVRHIPGSLFSVNADTVNAIDNLFCRNERLVCRFATSAGAVAVVFVGALNVGSITTPWTGELRAGRPVGCEFPIETGTRVSKGDLLGWFNMGSTVILLAEAGRVDWLNDLVPGAVCTMGQSLGTLNGTP
ncbi:MAG: archaetidylserine decarboxylase [Pseudomonadota bacterium]